MGQIFSKTVKKKKTKNINLKFQEAQQIPSKTDKKKTTPSHIIVKCLKTKDKK